MAISTEIKRIQDAADLIKQKTEGWNIGVTKDSKIDAQAEAISNIQEYAGEEITPTNEDQTISLEGKFATGDVTVKGVNYYYTGNTKPSNDETPYNDGDIFLII